MRFVEKLVNFGLGSSVSSFVFDMILENMELPTRVHFTEMAVPSKSSATSLACSELSLLSPTHACLMNINFDWLLCTH